MISYGKKSDQIHVILENYKDISIKGATRASRVTNDGHLNVGAVSEVVSDEQSLPSPMDDFFHRQSNKISFQDFFVRYCFTNYTSAKPLNLAGGLKFDPGGIAQLVELLI